MIRLFNKVFKPAPEVKLPTSDEAWSGDSNIYARNTFEKYNPDGLIGVKGYGIYKKMMMDEQVKAVVKFKRDAITSRDYYFELDAENSGLSEEEVKFRIDLSYSIVDNLKGSWTDNLNGMCSAMYNGFSMTEKIFGTFEYKKRNWWGIEKLKLKPFDTFTFHTDEFGNVLKLTQKFEGKEKELDLEKFLHFVVNPDVDEHYGQSELRECYRAWFTKENVYKFRNIYLERHAGGFRSVRPTDGSVIQKNSPEYNQWQDILQNVNVSTGLILPANREIITDYPQRNVAYDEAIQACDMAIARGLLVPNLIGISPQGDHGSLSQADSQVEVFMWTLQADSSRLEDALNEQLFRELGMANFGDENWPRFRFKPVSSSKQQNIISTWKDLVGAKAVTPTKTDETHIRELMDFPEAAKNEDENTESLNPKMDGAQVSSMLEITDKVRNGSLPPEAAIQIMIMSFPVDEEMATEIVGKIEVREPQPIPPQLQPGGNNAPSDNQNAPPSNSESGTGSNTDKEENNNVEAEKDSTIVGKGLVTISAFDRAVERVDFAVIGRTAEDGIETHTETVASVMGEMYRELMDRMPDIRADSLNKIKYDPKLVTKLRNRVKRALKDGWKVGERHAAIEVNKAKGEQFSADRARLNFIEAEYFDLVSFNVTGNLTENTLQIIKNIILNGIKDEKSLSEVTNQIYSSLASSGYISIEDVREALGQALNLPPDASPDARINTIVRTNTFKAINEARYNYFNDPALGGFVQAYEYSSILDSRTTAICEHMDGHIHAKNSQVWADGYKPPNHYNCRSILVPVTVRDKWVESPYPELSPQEGFK